MKLKLAPDTLELVMGVYTGSKSVEILQYVNQVIDMMDIFWIGRRRNFVNHYQ